MLCLEADVVAQERCPLSLRKVSESLCLGADPTIQELFHNEDFEFFIRNEECFFVLESIYVGNERTTIWKVLCSRGIVFCFHDHTIEITEQL